MYYSSEQGIPGSSGHDEGLGLLTQAQVLRLKLRHALWSYLEACASDEPAYPALNASVHVYTQQTVTFR